MAIDIEKNYMDKYQAVIATYTSLKLSSAATLSTIVVNFSAGGVLRFACHSLQRSGKLFY